MIEINVKQSAKQIDYPWIGIANDGQAVLFAKEKCGTILVDSLYEEGEVGNYEEGFEMNAFKGFKGTITISNK